MHKASPAALMSLWEQEHTERATRVTTAISPGMPAAHDVAVKGLQLQQTELFVSAEATKLQQKS